jgi:hypothetical protein
MSLLLLFPLAACSDYYPTVVTPPPATFDTTKAVIANNALAQWTGEHAWRIDTVPALVIQPAAASEQYPADPQTIFRNTAGEIVVTDGATAKLYVYGRNGAFLRTIAACSQSRVRFAQPYRGDSIVVYGGDMSLSIIAPDGTCARDVRIARPAATDANLVGDTLWGGELVRVYPDGSFLASSYGTAAVPEKRGSTWYTVKLYRATPEGAIRDTLGEFPGGEIFWARKKARPLEFARRLHAATDGFDLVIGESSAFRFLRVDTTGAVKMVARRNHNQSTVTEEDRRTVALFGNPANPDTQKLLSARKWPNRKPAFSSLIVDPTGHTWFEEYRFGVEDQVPDNPPTTFWSVFSREGVWLGNVEVPGRLLVRNIYNDMILGVWRNEDGVAGIRGYRLTKPDVPDETFESVVNVRRGIR